MLNIIQNTIGAIRRVGESVVRAGLKMWLPFTKAEHLGEELVTNGGFSDANTGWQSSGSNWTFSNNTAIYVGDGSANELLQNINLVGGKLYKIVIDVASTSGTLKFRFNNDQANRVTFNAVGENIIYFTPSGTGLINNDISISRETGVFNSVINSVSVEEYAQETPDISGNDNNAILKTGKALVFAGNDSVETSFPSSKTIKTIAFWIYPTHSANFETLFNLGITDIPVSPLGDRVIQLNHLTISNKSNYPLNFDVYIDGVYRGETNYNGDNPTLLLNQWQRVVLVNSNGTSTVNDTFDVAYTGSGSHGRFKMSDLQIYGTEFTTDDIAFDYANPQKLVTDNASSNVTLNDLHAWWHMSEGDGTIAFDSAPLLGGNLVANGDFSNGTTLGWTFENLTADISNNTLKLTSTTSTGNRAYYNISTEVGKTYQMSADVKSGATNSISGIGAISTTNPYNFQDGANAASFTTLKFVFTAVLTTTEIRFLNSKSGIWGGLNSVVEFDNVSVKEVFNIDGETYDGSSLGATYDDAQERIPQLGMMNWSKGSNVLPYSNDFQASSWTSAYVVFDDGYEAPDGTMTAWKLTRDGSPGFGAVYDLTVTPNIGVVRSIYAKTVSGTGDVHLMNYNTNSNSLITVTNEWQRFSISSASANAGIFYAVDFRGSSTLTEVILWGAQEEVNVGDSLSAFRKTDGTAVTDATLISSATDSQKDILGNAVRVKGSGFNLDGTGYGEVLDDSAFDIPACNNVDEGGFTLSAWVKPKYVSKSSSINVVSTLGGDVTQPGTGGIVVFDTNKIGGYINAAQLQADNTFIEGNWYYVVMTRSDSGNCKLYVDTNAQSDTDYTLGSITNSNNKMVGRDSLPYQRFYEERIDDVKFYNRELSSDEIEQNYNATKSGHNN